MNNDQIKGRAKIAKGSVKTAAGKSVGNKQLQNKGQVERAVGQAQADYGDLKEKLSRKF